MPYGSLQLSITMMGAITDIGLAICTPQIAISDPAMISNDLYLLATPETSGLWSTLSPITYFPHPMQMGNTNQDYSQNKPFSDPSHYHDYCEISGNDFSSHNLYNIERCRLAGLADLNQDNTYVADELIKWIQWLVSEFQFDGIRIDTVMMV